MCIRDRVSTQSTWGDYNFFIIMEQSQKVIEFYGIKNDYGEFSNFYPSPMTLDDKEWPTAEHYFQAMKFVGTQYEELVRQASTPGESKRLGGKRSWPLRQDWEQVKEDIMYKLSLIHI
eukprot:TRINITY_DN669_c0_g1_i12.p3 TRINITY_DN669_c0_g1~~TRINITY_DN669_c0_g1_i12.p3  ORF type:complete len:118 (-),score=26.32 TRINITY_DN669_c0_g1_i12:4-357(-)